MSKAKHCRHCEGSGWLLWPTIAEVQRCDSCGRFKSDLDAAQAFFKDTGGKLYGKQWHLDAIKLSSKKQMKKGTK